MSNATLSDTTEITKEQILAAQKAWGDGIVRISTAHTRGEDFESVARDHITKLYAYGRMPVLFKPTLAADVQFRSTFDEALSYFVATNGVCPEDTGFAIRGWTAVRFDNHDIITQGKSALAMGNYFFTNADGEEVKVEYSFGYVLNDDGEVQICLQHSSMPYEG